MICLFFCCLWVSDVNSTWEKADWKVRIGTSLGRLVIHSLSSFTHWEITVAGTTMRKGPMGKEGPALRASASP